MAGDGSDAFADEAEPTVTIDEYIEGIEAEELEADLVLGGDDGKDCTYGGGYLTRQAVFSCLTCVPAGNAGVCTACSLNCHDGHEAMPGCICFKTAPLEHEGQMRIMFETVVVTNESSYVPTSGANDDPQGETHAEGDGIEDIGVTPHEPSSLERRSEKRPPLYSPKGKKKKTIRDQYMKRLVEAYELKVQSSSATSQAVDHVRNEIGSMLAQVIDDGANEESDEHFYATQLLQKKENRDVFVTLKTTSGRLNWLRRAWEIRKKN